MQTLMLSSVRLTLGQQASFLFVRRQHEFFTWCVAKDVAGEAFLTFSSMEIVSQFSFSFLCCGMQQYLGWI